MAEDDSGVIFGNPDAPIPIGFGNPDAPNPIGFGFPTKQAKVRKCATVIRCPGEDFLNYSTECDDVDYAGGTILKCLDQATPIDFFVKAPGIGPWTWDVQNLPDGVMFLVNDFCPSLLNIFGILTSDQTTTTIITVTDGFGNVTVMKITFSTSTVGPCGTVPSTPIICTETCPGPGDSFTVVLCDDTEQVYDIPADATPEQVLAIQAQAADAYYRSLLTCNLTQPPPNPPPPNLLWFNQSQTWTDTCPDGSFFFYTVGANKYAASTLLAANTRALAVAKRNADRLFICITPQTLPDGATGTAYSQQLTVTHGTAPYVFAIVSGALPTGLTLSSSGLISGTPTVSGLATFQVKVTDASNPQKTTTVSYTINVPSPVTIDAYWTLNEGNGFFQVLADSTGNNRFLQAILNYSGSTPALFSNGALCTSAGPDLEMDGTMPYAQLGWSVWGWVKIISTSAINDNTAKIIVLGNGSYKAVMAIGSSSDPGNVHLTENILANEIYLNISVGAWHFFHLLYNHSTQKIGVSFDNGLPTFLPSTTSDAGITALDFELIFQINDPGLQVLYDEIGMIGSTTLSPTQLTYLYNSGAGRTWPIVLPP